MAAEESREPGRVRGMFDSIAARYDLLNHLLSANLDRRWRRQAARELAGEARRVLDLCGGTGDQSVAVTRVDGVESVVCCDFSHEMLCRATAKFHRLGVADRCTVLEADGLRLPFVPGRFDAVTVAFGVRNFVDLDAGFDEILRVLRPGGRMVVLEFSRPRGWILGGLYGLYLRRVLPRLGDRISRRSGPYGYLASTIAGFPEPGELAARIRAAGFGACEWTLLSGGIVAIHTAVKSP